VRRPARHPWLATVAVIASAFVTGILLRALAPLVLDAPAAVDHHAGALQRAATRIVHDPGSRSERSTATRTGR
jgi:archaellum component FlaG (FlaF/FlaG flagellin family)